MNGASESDHTARGTDFLLKVLGDAMNFNLKANVALSTRLPEDDAWIMLAKGTAWRTMNAGRPCDKPYTGISEGERQHLNLTDDYWLLEKLLQEKSNDLYRAVSTLWKAPKRDVPLPDVDSWIINQMYVMKDQLTETTFFTTENGYIGSSATAIEEGDVICILFGSKVPAVLRPQGHKDRLVSFAYIDGIMNGELTRDETQAASKQESFEII